MQPELSKNYVEVPLGDGTVERNSPLYVGAMIDGGQASLSIRGDISFRNLVGEQAHEEYIGYLNPSQRVTLRERLLGKLGIV